MTSKLPTRKWIANAVTGLAGWLILILQSNADSITNTEWVALVVIAAQLVVTYLVPNEQTPGGTPLKRSGVAGLTPVGVVVALLLVVLIVVLLPVTHSAVWLLLLVLVILALLFL